MILLIIGAILCAIFVIHYAWFDDMVDTMIGKIAVTIFGVPIGIAVGVLLGIVSSIIIGTFLMLAPQKETETYRQQIYSVKDDTSYSGRFILGTGYVQSDLKIYYIVETKYGKQIQSQSKEKIYLIETNEESPNVKVIATEYKYGWLNWVGINPNSFSEKVILTVPTDTIEIQYEIDLE